MADKTPLNSPFVARAGDSGYTQLIDGKHMNVEDSQVEARKLLKTPEMQAKWLSQFVKSKDVIAMWLAVGDVAWCQGNFELCKKAVLYAEYHNNDTDKVVEAIVSMGFRFKIKKNPFKNWVTHIRK